MKIAGFDDAFTLLIGHEGSYSNNPNDPGGETMWGVTRRVADAYGYLGEMRELPIETAKAIAKKQYWDKYQLDQINPELAFQVFDCAYNGGYAVKWLQEAAGVNPDGLMGAKTIAAVRGIELRMLIMRFDASRLDYLAGLPRLPTFAGGWMRRIAANLREGAD